MGTPTFSQCWRINISTILAILLCSFSDAVRNASLSIGSTLKFKVAVFLAAISLLAMIMLMRSIAYVTRLCLL